MDQKENVSQPIDNSAIVSLIKNESNFTKDGDFDIDLCNLKLDEVVKDLNNFNLFQYLSGLWEITKYFKEIGTMLSYASDDVRAKINIIRDDYVFPEFSQCYNFQDFITTETKLGIHILNSENNKECGFKKGNRWYKYESGKTLFYQNKLPGLCLD